MTDDKAPSIERALIERKGTRAELNEMVSQGYAYWVPTNYLTAGGYFLTDKGEVKRLELIATLP